MKRETQLLLRLTQPEKAAFDAAASISGVNTSAWCRQQLRMAAVKELRSANKKIPFLELPSPGKQ
ncbi:MAG: hypothetical protein AB7I98_17365 [Verrucomicrobiales bacterium]